MNNSSNVNLTFGDANDLWLESVKNPQNSGHDLFIFSPFITGNVTLELIHHADYSDAYVITNLKAQSILAGSLDLHLIHKLIQNDVKVFHLDNLHSKILFYGHDLIIGSQNFTRGGKRNEEATVGVAVTNEFSDRVIDYVNDSIEKSSPIAETDLERLGKNVELLRIEYQKLQALLEQSETNFLRKRETNQKYKEVANETALKLMRLCDKNRWNVIKIDRKKYTIPQKENEYYYTFIRTKAKMTLNEFKSIPSKKRVTLEHQRRYLGINLHNLQPFWLPANKTQVGKFSRTKFVSASFKSLKINQIELVDPNENNSFANVIFACTDNLNGNIQLKCFFDGEEFLLRNPPSLTDIEHIELLRVLEELLFHPFDYEETNFGDKPNRYFKKGKRYNLSLIEFKDFQFLALSETEGWRKKLSNGEILAGNENSYIDHDTFFNVE